MLRLMPSAEISFQGTEKTEMQSEGLTYKDKEPGTGASGTYNSAHPPAFVSHQRPLGNVLDMRVDAKAHSSAARASLRCQSITALPGHSPGCTSAQPTSPGTPQRQGYPFPVKPHTLKTNGTSCSTQTVKLVFISTVYLFYNKRNYGFFPGTSRRSTLQRMCCTVNITEEQSRRDACRRK